MIKNVLRWIAVLPSSILGTCVGSLFAKLYMWLNTSSVAWYTGNLRIMDVILLGIVPPAIEGYLFVVVGRAVAPSHKKVVGFVLAGILVALSIITIVYSIVKDFDWIGILGGVVSGAVGIHAACNNSEDEDS
jgi:hypothetical protein